MKNKKSKNEVRTKVVSGVAAGSAARDAGIARARTRGLKATKEDLVRALKKNPIGSWLILSADPDDESKVRVETSMVTDETEAKVRSWGFVENKSGAYEASLDQDDAVRTIEHLVYVITWTITHQKKG